MRKLIAFGGRFKRHFAFGAALLMLATGLLVVVTTEAAYRRGQLRDLDIQAAILGQSVAAPLMFSDGAAARENADAFAANPDIDAVGVYDENGALVASFMRSGAAPLPAKPAPAPAAYRGGYIAASAPVARDGQSYGYVYVRRVGDSALVTFGRFAPVGLLAIMAALVLAVAGAAQAALRRANSDLTGANARLSEEIAQRRHAEEALLQSRKMEAIGQLTGGVAHDFNNLLMVISGGLRMLNRHEDPARRQKAVDAMHQAVERGAGLTRQLLAFARRQPLQFKTIDVERQIAGMRELLERSLRADILLDASFPEGLPPIRTDPGQFELAILNLSVNARDAMQKGGLLTITAQRAGETVEIVVRDTGTGIAPDVVDRIFEPYFTTKQLGQGTGLGLSQVYGFVQQCGGALRVDTELNRGAAFTLSLPISDEPLNEVQAPSMHEGPQARRAILVVEDDDQVADTVCAMLDELGHAAIRARSASEAVDILDKGGAFDLVFSDIVMPGGKSGLELADDLEKRAPQLPVLLTTGYTGGGAPVEIRRPLLRKPYQIQELRDAIAAVSSVAKR